MKLHFSLALLFAALSACEPPLPDGAFVEDTGGGGGMPGGSAVDAGGGGRGDAGIITIPSMTGGTTSDASVVPVGGGDAGTAGGVMGATGGVGGNDAGAQLSEQAMRLERLVGRYLMRMDMLSTVSVSQLIGNVKTSNRISHLSVTEVHREGEKIWAWERLCHQTYQHRCLENSCTSVSTTMSPQVVRKLTEPDPTTRVYTFTGNDFTTDAPLQFLGYDGKTNASLPTNISDARVWDTIAGSGPREGLLLSLTARAAGLINIVCDTYNVQSFSGKFSGKASGSDGFPSFVNNAGYTLTIDTKAETLGTNNTKDCAPGKDNATSQVGKQTVRFALLKADEFTDQAFWGCPEISEWDKRLAAPAP